MHPFSYFNPQCDVTKLVQQFVLEQTFDSNLLIFSLSRIRSFQKRKGRYLQCQIFVISQSKKTLSCKICFFLVIIAKVQFILPYLAYIVVRFRYWRLDLNPLLMFQVRIMTPHRNFSNSCSFKKSCTKYFHLTFRQLGQDFKTLRVNS